MALRVPEMKPKNKSSVTHDLHVPLSCLDGYWRSLKRKKNRCDMLYSWFWVPRQVLCFWWQASTADFIPTH